MGSTRRSFTPEYKAEAVKLVIDGGRTLAEVSRNIGCHEVTLGNWVKKARKDRESAAADAPLTEDEKLELLRLRAEVKEKDAALAEARMQIEFAKKVAAWFAKEKP